MKKLSKIFAVVLVLAMALSMLPMGAAAATTEKCVELTADALGLVDKYADGTPTVSGVAFAFEEMANYGDGIQMRTNKKDTATPKKHSILSNTSAFAGGITKIELVWSTTKTNGYSNADAFTFTFGNAAGELAHPVNLSTVKEQASYVITPDATTYTYFQMELNLSYTFYWDSIKIYYNETVADDNTNNDNTNNDNTTGGDNTDNTPDATGDNTAIVAMTSVMAIAVAALAVLVVGKKRMF